MEEKRTTAFGQFSGGDLHPVLLIREVFRKFWAIVLAAVIFGCCGYVLRDATYEPIYRTSTTLVVMQGGSTSVYGNRSAANTLANNLSKLLNGEMLTFLFTPQDDSDYMLTVAEIMASFRM